MRVGLEGKRTLVTGAASGIGRAIAEAYEKVYDESMRTNMLSALIPPTAIAEMAVYLAGEPGRYVTGQAINVCAGLSIH